MPPRTRADISSAATSHGAVLAAAGAAVLTTLVLLGPALRPGYALYLDHVTVPDPAAPTRAALTTPGGLRSWPLDGVTWVWSQLLPPWTLHLFILLLATAGAGLGAGVLLRRLGWGAAAGGAVLTIANPYVVERLLLGQPGLLLGYAALPWIAVATRQHSVRRRLGGLVVAMLPALLTPWSALLAVAAAVGCTVLRRRSVREVVAVLGVGLLLCLPWLVPALATGSGGADPAGAVAFRLADDLGFGTMLAALTGGGVWSAAAHGAVRTGLLGVAVTVVLVIVAAVGTRITSRADHRPLSWLPITVVFAVPGVLWLLGGPSLEAWSRAQAVPGVALFRDLHRVLAPATFALVVLVVAGLVVAGRWLSVHGGSGSAGLAPTMVVLVCVSLAVMLVPGGPARLHTAYRPVPFSPEWTAAVAAVGGEGRVLSLPWQPLRRADWAPNTFLDPTHKALGARAVTDHRLTVQRPDGVVVVADPGAAGETLSDTLVRGLTAEGSDPLPSELLVSSGIRHLLIWTDSPGWVPPAPAGWVRTFAGSHFVVWSAPVTAR